MHESDESIPLYLKTCETLRKYMLQPGVRKRGKLPSEPELVRELGVSRNTLRKSLSILASEGFVKRIKNRGTLLCSVMHGSNPYVSNASIGAVFPCTSYWNKTLEILKGKVQEAHYKFRLYLYSKGNPEDEIKTFYEAKDECIGIFLHPDKTMHDRQTIEKTLAENYPLVLFGATYETIPCNMVALDNFQAGYRMTKMMLDEGRRHIVFLSNDENFAPTNKRLEGCKQALYDYNIIFDDKDKLPCTNPDLKKFLIDRNPDGIISFYAEHAFVAMSILLQEGKEIPKDVRIGRFGPSLNAPEYKDFMFVVSFPEELFCTKMFEIMIETITKPDNSCQKIYINQEIFLNA